MVHYARIMKEKLKRLFLIILILLTPAIALAQDKVHPPSPDNIVMDGTPPPPGLPIDLGISALIAAGLGLGIHQLRNKK